MSPGAVTEKLYLFIAEYEPDMKVGDGGGLEGEGEDIERLELPFAAAMGRGRPPAARPTTAAMAPP